MTETAEKVTAPEATDGEATDTSSETETTETTETKATKPKTVKTVKELATEALDKGRTNGKHLAFKSYIEANTGLEMDLDTIILVMTRYNAWRTTKSTDGEFNYQDANKAFQENKPKAKVKQPQTPDEIKAAIEKATKKRKDEDERLAELQKMLEAVNSEDSDEAAADSDSETVESTEATDANAPF
jgi:hypothetical protein